MLRSFLSHKAVSISLFCAGFGESMAETTGWDNTWAVRVIGLITSLVLLFVVLAGVKWVVKLQLLLLAILMLSVLDFLVGTFAHTDYGKSFITTRNFSRQLLSVGVFIKGDAKLRV